MTYTRNRMMRDYGHEMSLEDFHAGLDGLAAAGTLHPGQVALYRAAVPILPDHGAALAQQIAADRSLRVANAPTGIDAVRDPVRYQMAAQAYHAHAAQMASEAQAIGLPDTAAAIEQTALAHSGSAAGTAFLKASVRDDHLAQIAHAGRRAAAARLFTHRLMTHGPETP